ncbi:hypothetical protein D6817_00040 [Candidatus Pacearchaeota archaeon]|nr:MAG: hypothetical protein D6817_00040 [Candidatus Pacearchaeota archaeon]
MARCVYCKKELAEGTVVDVCRSCGVQVWGERMFNAIVDNMTKARESGDLYQGSVSSHAPQEAAQQKKPMSIVSEALEQLNENQAAQATEENPSALH